MCKKYDYEYDNELERYIIVDKQHFAKTNEIKIIKTYKSEYAAYKFCKEYNWTNQDK